MSLTRFTGQNYAVLLRVGSWHEVVRLRLRPIASNAMTWKLHISRRDLFFSSLQHCRRSLDIACVHWETVARVSESLAASGPGCLVGAVALRAQRFFQAATATGADSGVAVLRIFCVGASVLAVAVDSYSFECPPACLAVVGSRQCGWLPLRSQVVVDCDQQGTFAVAVTQELCVFVVLEETGAFFPGTSRGTFPRAFPCRSCCGARSGAYSCCRRRSRPSPRCGSYICLVAVRGLSGRRFAVFFRRTRSATTCTSFCNARSLTSHGGRATGSRGAKAPDRSFACNFTRAKFLQAKRGIIFVYYKNVV